MEGAKSDGKEYAKREMYKRQEVRGEVRRCRHANAEKSHA